MFGRRKPKDPERNDTFEGLRRRLISSDPAALRIAPSDRFPHVWAALFELGMDRGVASIVCVSDGSTSMYVSTGGGIIGAGEHAAVVEANHRFLDAVERSMDLLQRTDALPLPTAGEARFNVLTFEGRRTSAAPQEELGRNESPLSPLFFTGHDVITQLRLIAPS